MGREVRLLLVKVDRDDIEMDRRALAQGQQDVEQGITVFSYAHKNLT